MKKYLVWDEINESREDASEISALYESDAAERYAEDDADGNIDSIYDGKGHVICVVGDDNVVRRFNVTVEYDPIYYASELTEGQDKA